jgi:hypothetical protein
LAYRRDRRDNAEKEEGGEKRSSIDLLYEDLATFDFGRSNREDSRIRSPIGFAGKDADHFFGMEEGYA